MMSDTTPDPASADTGEQRATPVEPATGAAASAAAEAHDTDPEVVDPPSSPVSARGHVNRPAADAVDAAADESARNTAPAPAVTPAPAAPAPAAVTEPARPSASPSATGPAAAVDMADSPQLSTEATRAVRAVQRATRRPRQWARPTLGDEHACMVVAGIGFDAGLVASTRPALKARVGWGAYALAAMENLSSPRMDLVLSLLDEAGARRVERLRARNLLVANGGRLPAGITLLPQARTDDGLLDVAAIDTVAGLAGWSSLARQVLPPYAAHYSESGRSLGRVVMRRGGEVAVQLSAPALVEVDGDLLAPTQGMRVRIDPGALLIRRPPA